MIDDFSVFLVDTAFLRFDFGNGRIMSGDKLKPLIGVEGFETIGDGTGCGMEDELGALGCTAPISRDDICRGSCVVTIVPGVSDGSLSKPKNGPSSSDPA